ncbi:cobyrinate a,c-diamide synthase [Rhizobium sp. L1K21]|uniref:cobyrinate a,c-diamide synthase n=1 Tax=Rhizobium sp. L1K21 TaxID=2954933 RepID=UPI002092CCD9|nr:cobyrinate a,c-diamide synthase [Rhizobium sp. L1K21]MCO6185801.1 cobyrinate a,c-diamide synthase [Rhizobium sp. L1K21]
MSGLLIAAPSSGSGKTSLTLGLLRALRRLGIEAAPGKAGPDYIDPAFHAAASGTACLNFDPWAMRPEFLRVQAAQHAKDRPLIVEAMMGLYDAAADGSGSPADLAALLGLNIILVVDCARMSHSVAALVRGFMIHRPDINVAGVILNRVGSERHEAMLRSALDAAGIRVFGAVVSDPAMQLPERHLGLVQAGEHAGLERFIEHAADLVELSVDMDALLGLAGERHAFKTGDAVSSIPPLGNRIAVARDLAFAFSYEHLLRGWRNAGAEITFFSPLSDHGPDEQADAIYLPGGYPELHAGRLAAASHFKAGMLAAHEHNTRIYGECGGYMVLGEGLISADGTRHAMLGLLPVITTFAERKRHLGYRVVEPVSHSFFAETMTAHEFHYSTVVAEGPGEPLFTARDAVGTSLGTCGLRLGKVAGSYMHLVDIAGSVE